ncbi:MAG TPA: hypothetical protein PL187_22640, partial [Caldilinea sp.]|nr:hypothetical protein [Caldilinea sp.]
AFWGAGAGDVAGQYVQSSLHARMIWLKAMDVHLLRRFLIFIRELGAGCEHNVGLTARPTRQISG